MAAPTLQASIAHAGNPTTAPTGTFGTTQAGDILFVFVVNGGADADPTISGTTITSGGLTWTRKVSANGGALTDVNGSLWWTRATGNHTGQTVIAATTNSGSLAGGVIRSAIASGDPFDNATATLLASGVNTVVGFTPSVAECLVLIGLCVDDNIASDTYTGTGSPTTYIEAQDIGSTGGNDTQVALASNPQTTAAPIGTISWNNARGAGIFLVAIVAAVKPIPNTTLVVADGTHAHAADNLALTQLHNLTVADGAHAHAADGVALVQQHTIAVADGAHAHAADNITLILDSTLVVQDATHAVTSDSVTLVTDTVLVVQDAAHALSSDDITLVVDAAPDEPPAAPEASDTGGGWYSPAPPRLETTLVVAPCRHRVRSTHLVLVERDVIGERRLRRRRRDESVLEALGEW
jgi:hypothetical protein